MFPPVYGTKGRKCGGENLAASITDFSFSSHLVNHLGLKKRLWCLPRSVLNLPGQK